MLRRECLRARRFGALPGTVGLPFAEAICIFWPKMVGSAASQQRRMKPLNLGHLGQGPMVWHRGWAMHLCHPKKRDWGAASYCAWLEVVFVCFCHVLSTFEWLGMTWSWCHATFWSFWCSSSKSPCCSLLYFGRRHLVPDKNMKL